MLAVGHVPAFRQDRGLPALPVDGGKTAAQGFLGRIVGRDPAWLPPQPLILRFGRRLAIGSGHASSTARGGLATLQGTLSSNRGGPARQGSAGDERTS
jgi:hypothetical protein